MANGVDIPDARVAKVRRLRTPGAAAREAGSLLTDFARRRTCSHPLLACACRFPFIPPSLTTPFQTLQPSAAAAGQAPPPPIFSALPSAFPHTPCHPTSPTPPRQVSRRGRLRRAAAAKAAAKDACNVPEGGG